MATTSEVSSIDGKLQALKLEILQTFEELNRCLLEHRDNLLSRIARMSERQDKNVELEKAIKQLRITRDNILGTMTSNLVGHSLDTVRETLDRDIELKVAEKLAVNNLECVRFRCFSEKIRNAIKETDLIEVIPEYVGRENPVLKKCGLGSGNGELNSPRGISIDKINNEVFIADKNNSRIQVLNTEGKYLRSFGTDHLKEPFGICVSQNGVFVADRATERLLKFTLSGQLVKEIGSRGNVPGCFKGISGLCCEAGSVYVCDCNLQRIQVFNLDLKFVKQFGIGELILPRSIASYLVNLYILLQDQNVIYCYRRDGTFLRKIKLTGQEQQMTAALFFTMDKQGNFIVSDSSVNEIRIFSPNGVLKHVLGRGHLVFLTGVALDNSDNIICVCNGNGIDRFQKF